MKNIRLLLAALLFVAPAAAVAQPTSVLHIKIALTDAGQTTPVPGHVLLVSENPTSAPPRVVRTAVDGTVDVRLRPGNYTIESDKPVVFHGRAFEWTRTLDVVAGRDSVLELTAANADTATAGPAVAPGSRPLESDPAFLLPRWQDSVVTLWTPTSRASAFVIDARGLLATNQKAVGAAATAEVQITPAVKVAARVLAADVARDVAVLWIDPQAIASVKPIPLGCPPASPALPARPARPALPALPAAQEVFAIGTLLSQVKDATSGTVGNLVLPAGSDGGPVFTAEGTLVGITSLAGESDRRHLGRVKVVGQADACDVVASAEAKMTSATPPGGAHLPVEPDRQLPEQALKEAAARRAGSLNPYQVASSGFDVAFITPVMIAGARNERLFDFGSWSWYVESRPSVLLVRVTPKMVQGFWQKVARGAAYTQGVAIPAITHASSGFLKLRAYCGEREVTPIHPFVLEQRVSEKEAVVEGLYAFDPGAFGPHCETVKLVLFSEKEPEKGETRVVESAIVQRIWEDLANVR